MYIVYANESFLSCYRSSGMTKGVVTSLEPLATCSTKKKAERLANLLSDRGAVVEIIHVSGKLPHDPDGITRSMRKKLKLTEPDPDDE